MGAFAALDVSQKETAICLVDQAGTVLAESKVSTRPEAIAGWLDERCDDLEQVGVETGPLACGSGMRWSRGRCRSFASVRDTPRAC